MVTTNREQNVPAESLQVVLRPFINQTIEQKLPKRAYQILRLAIRSLKLLPGQTILESEVAHVLNMSRTPIREALIQLQTEGLVKLIPRRGFKVAPIEEENMKEIYELVESLDGLAVELATKRMTNDELEKLEELNIKQIEALAKGDLNEWAILDDRFHLNIIEFAGNTRLEVVTKIYIDQIFRARLHTINYRPIPQRSITEHQAILACMKAKDEYAARHAMQSHRKRSRDEILEVLKGRKV